MSCPDPARLPGRARDVAARLPFTLVFLGLMLVANGLSGTMSGHLAPEVLRARGIGVAALRDGDLLRFVTATFLSHDRAMLLRQLVFAGAVIGAAEWRWGTWRAAALFFGIDGAATVLLLALVVLVPGLGVLADTTDVGMSLGGFGLIGVLLTATRHRRLALAVTLGLVAAKYGLSPDPLADGGHVIALVIGFGLGGTRYRRPGLANDPAVVQQLPMAGQDAGQADKRRPGCPAGARQQDGQR